jgi:hypothetical protein
MFYYKIPLLNIFVFSFINIFIKIIPLWLIRNKPYKIQDFIFGCILFVIFSFSLSLYNTNFIKVNQNIIEAIKEGVPATPIEYYIVTLINNNFNK